MSTTDRFLAVTDKKTLARQDLDTRLLKYLRKLATDVHKTAYGQAGVFAPDPITMGPFGSVADRFQLNTDLPGVDGAGHFVQTTVELAGRDVGIAFKNQAATTYYVGLHYAERPRGIQPNSRTSLPEFVEWEETVGFSAQPAAIVNNGANLTFNINTVTQPFSGAQENMTGRKCLVWKVQPGGQAITEGVAIEQCIVSFSGSVNSITTAGLFGQLTGAVDTTLASYMVLLLGPTVSSTTNISLQAGYLYVGAITGNGPSAVPPGGNFSSGGQNILTPLVVAANAISRLDAHGFLKVAVQADAGDVDNNIPQMRVINYPGTAVFTVNENGDTVIAGTLNVTGTAVLGALTLNGLTVNGAALIGSDEAQNHVHKGNLAIRNNAAALVGQRRGSDGGMGIAGAAHSGAGLHAHGGIYLNDADADQVSLYGILAQLRASDSALMAQLAAGGKLGLGGAARSDPLAVYGNAQVDLTALLGQALTGGSAANARVARLKGGLNNVSGSMNLWENILGLATGDFQRWSDDTGHYFVKNATFDGTNWSKIVTSPNTPAFRVSLGLFSSGTTSEVRFEYQKAAVNSPWLPAAWILAARFDMTNGQLVLGEGFGGDGKEAESTNVRLNIPFQQDTTQVSFSTYTLLFGSKETGSAASQAFRVYAVTGPTRNGLLITLNCRWDVATHKWIRDFVGLNWLSGILQLSNPGSGAGSTATYQLKLDLAIPGLFTTSYDDSDFTTYWQHQVDYTSLSGIYYQRNRQALTNGRLEIAGISSDANGSNPASNVMFKNTLCAKNMTKVFGRVLIVAGAVSGLGGVAVGSCISSVEIVGGPNVLRVHFAGANFATAGGQPLITPIPIIDTDATSSSTTGCIPRVANAVADYIDIEIYDRDASAWVTLNDVGTSLSLSFILMGQQNT